MNAHSEDELDAIFAQFDSDRRSASPQPLADWISRYPELRDSLVMWATELPSIEMADGAPGVPWFEERSLEAGMAVLRRSGLAEEARISTLNDAARAQGARPRDVAEAVGVGMAVFAKLNRRLIRAASVPAGLIDRLAAALQLTSGEVRLYLQRPPSLAAGAAYRADQPPEVREVQDFQDAILTSQDMTDEQKQAWR